VKVFTLEENSMSPICASQGHWNNLGPVLCKTFSWTLT